MAVLIIKDRETYELTAELARRRGETLTQAVKTSVKERLARERALEPDASRLVERVMELGKRISLRPVLDPRTPEEIVGYDEIGIPRL